MGVNCPAGNATHELGLRTHKEDKVIIEECVKQRLILRKRVLHSENFKEKGCAKFVRNAVRISKRSSASCKLTLMRSCAAISRLCRT